MKQAMVKRSGETTQSPWIERWCEHEAFRRAIERLRTAPTGERIRLGSVWGAAKALSVAAIQQRLGQTVVALVRGPEHCDDLFADLRFFLAPPGENDLEPAAAPGLYRFPAWEHLREGATPDPEIAAERLETLLACATSQPPRIVVAPVAALLQPTPCPEALAAATLRLELGAVLDLAMLEKRLEDAGFERVPLAEAPGEWSRRGGIIDLVALGSEPVRIELFGDEIDTLRTFDPETQRSVKHHERLDVLLIAPERLHAATGRAQPRANLWGHLPGDAIVCAIEPEALDQMASELGLRMTPGADAGTHTLFKELERRRWCTIEALPVERGVDAFDLGTRSVERTSGLQLEEVISGVRALMASGTRVTVLARRAGERRRLRELLTTIGGELEVLPGEVTRGFEEPGAGWALVSARELFRRPIVHKPRAKPARERVCASPIEHFVELRPGDLVVHVSHGIGRFLGMETIRDTAGRAQEYLKIEFADQVTVYVPSTRIELVQRYVGTKGAKPKLSRIGTGGWRKRRRRVERAVIDMAAELLETQARREAQQGTAHPPGGAWLEAFEAAFPFDLTPDQEAAWRAIRADLESPRPLDRLICGDVGYGKTELAMRAAFQVAIGGRQVAVLVPTTVLAEQHLQTFRSRMAAFPVRVECLNRFRTGREQRAILAGLASGEIDIVIGTHRLLSADVTFKNVGLLIIDEEQRFGVAHKERLKRLRATIDVLTLTATPIPRTLHLALLGIKDISALETAPRGRVPIRTVIAREDSELVRDAILEELAREGQCFVVHNRVQTIAKRAREIADLVPQARVAMVHGQMPEAQIEQAMASFVRGEADVLVATTIIESGLDIPRANTLIIDRADRFGLAELHQLRGRVGRYTHQAHAFLLLPKHAPVREEARRRLKALEELNHLGAGFRIAMRDLEIRGAGNILGSAQSGHIAAVGYDLYCRLLRGAVKELKARTEAARADLANGDGNDKRRAAARAIERERERAMREGLRQRPLVADMPVDIELALEAYLPESWIPQIDQKLDAYRLLAAARDADALLAARDALRDRYGPLPPAARTLVRIHLLRIACEALGIVRVQAEGKVAILWLEGNGDRLRARLAESKRRALWPEPGVCYLVVSDQAGTPHAELLRILIDTLLPEPEAALSEREQCDRAPRGRARRNRSRTDARTRASHTRANKR